MDAETLAPRFKCCSLIVFPLREKQMRVIPLTLAFILIGFVHSVQAESPPVHEMVLKNGLKVLVKEDHRAPVSVFQVWYKVGSSYEHEGITGVSHILEHMMFQGTENLEAGEFSKIIAENGGRENAFTGRDYTAYFQQMEKSRLEVSFRLEAERMHKLRLNQDEYDKERQVVMEERRLRTEDKPRSQTYEYFMASAHLTSPYRNPIIGWMQDLEAMKLQDLADWYQRWYAPNNATIVVAGDVDPKQVFALAEQYFGNIPAVEFEPVRIRLDVPQAGVRRLIVKQPAQLPYLVMGYQTPVLNGAEEDWEPYALEMLAGVLSGGSSARLPARLVRAQQIASSASAGYDLYARLPSLLTLSGQPTADHTLEELEQALLIEIEALQTEPVSAEELARIKAQVVASAVYERDSYFYQAMQLGMLETVGLGWQHAEEYVHRLRQVTAEQVQAVAQKYLTPDRLTVAHMLPQPMNAKGAEQGAEHAE